MRCEAGWLRELRGTAEPVGKAVPARAREYADPLAREIELETLDTSVHKDRFGKTLAAVGPGAKAA